MSLNLPPSTFYYDRQVTNDIDNFKIVNLTEEVSDPTVPIEVKYSEYFHSEVYLMIRQKS